MDTTNNAKDLSRDLVVVGSSAGGVEALSILVSTLPLDFPAPIVLAQHLDPSRPSNLDVILQRRTALPVEVVKNHTKLEPGKVYVVPSNHHVSIHDHEVELLANPGKRPRPSVDTLLSTAAEAYGEHLIATILTGSGSDGAIGAIDVKNQGGTVVVQDPRTARYPSMPLALPPTVVDFEVGIEQIGPLLYDLLTGVNVPQVEERTEDVLREILAYVSRHASIDFRAYKVSTILRRIGRRMTVTHNHTMRDYLEYLHTSAKEVGELVQAFLINVTQFFRDAEAFDYLRTDVLPQLIEKARNRNRELRVWTAGCATGEEPYSLAMLLTDMLGAELPEWSIKIFATDLDEAAINYARRGFYPENLLKGIPTAYRERYFERADHGYRIAKTLRQMVIFGQQDLSKSAPFPHMDLVLCRNVLIYFTPELQDYVLNQFAFSLYPNGYLFLGKAETVRPQQSFYELVSKHWKVYRCVNNALPSMRHPSLAEAGVRSLERHVMGQPHKPAGQAKTEQEAVAGPIEIGQLRRLNELLLRFLPVGVMVLDRSYHIVSSNATARRLLELRDLAGEQDFLHAVRGIPYHEMRNAIDKIFRERNPVNLPEIELDTATGGSGRFLSFSITPMQFEAGAPDLVMLSITDATQQVQVRQQLAAVRTEQSQLMDELGAANKHLNDVNKELTDSNEELQVANEELVLTHEELQASIEEFETTNEELQATNEELETNNEELQATNEELETTNDELRARTGELQELTTILENERGRLSEMVELAPFYILVLRGPSLLVEAYNPRNARLLEGKAVQIQGRPLDQIIDQLWENGVEIVHVARDAYRLDRVQHTPRILTYLPTAHGRKQEAYFTYTIVPSHDPLGKVDGVILYAIDETAKHLHEVQEEIERIRLIFANLSMAAAALFDANTAQLIMASPRYLQIVSEGQHIAPESLPGHAWFDLTFPTPPDQIRTLWQQVQKTRAAQHLPECSYQATPESSESIWDYHLIPLLEEEDINKVRFMLVLAIETTEMVKARRELEVMDSMKDDFLALATHELRTPLQSILGNTQMLQILLQRQQTGQPEQVQQQISLLKKVEQQTQRASKLISEMLDVTRIRGNVFELHPAEHVDLVQLVQRVVEQYQHNQREVSVEAKQTAIEGTYDADRIEQVLTNLINNALKYSPKHQPVSVTIEQRHDSPAEAVISVKDSGPGISAKDQGHIFERFYRSTGARKGKVDGLGLGLYIAHEIVTQQGGKIWLQSKPGEGSTFCFSLPLANGNETG